MTFRSAINQAQIYNISTPVYEGPLDLLLQLIERAELDITRLALAQVTDQYLLFIKTLDELSAEDVSAFLVIATKLLQIKSEALLPRPPVREEGEEDPGEALAQQLITYKLFKKAAESLAERGQQNLRTHLRLAPTPVVEASLDLSNLSLDDLLESARLAFSKLDYQNAIKVGVPYSIFSIRKKIDDIIQKLRVRGTYSFWNLLNGPRSRLEIAVTFIAVLELIKQNMVKAYQEKLFGEIEIEINEEWSGDEDFELEFGE